MARGSVCLPLSLSRWSAKFLPATENARGRFPYFSIFWNSLYTTWTVCPLVMDLSPRCLPVVATCYHQWVGEVWQEWEPTARETVEPSSAGSDAGRRSHHWSFSSYLSEGLPLYIISNKSGILSSIITRLLDFWACQNQTEEEKDYLKEISFQVQAGRHREKARAID